ncbi:glycosyltransferase family 2 protein [Niveispirillum cyanobacteriorum]|uniref:Family 2 glycosyl transferase n=1 Tax=Niveispirillum cyanobacteriorum TaxID=1612173 RepID=A0A2K9NJ21_9PROT|nr:glycosyltransferase family 2 protein [Niveispirillum cyanobacteriorum]AUN33072.1 family 2 glycosyl transferase [Niveispirillum cyanobacteriorum]GGE45624.1 glycosyl transferase [Niveispirillum cyanobacteriorum]
MTGSVDILLATYNGASYLPALLASLEAQTHAGFRVLISDDGSTDDTPDLLREWATRFGNDRAHILTFPTRAGGACPNFARLLAASDANYVLFADQDDHWHPTKVARTLESLRALESEHSTERPCLAFCDLRVVDADLAVHHPSLWAFQGLDIEAGLHPRHLLMENVVTGCAMGINAAARRQCLPIPDKAIMHDWWLALCCTFTGHVAVIPEALIDYRQHGGNDVGASRWNLLQQLLARLHNRSDMRHQKYRAFLNQRFDQAAAVAEMLGPSLPAAERELIEEYVALRHRSWLRRRLDSIKFGFGPRDPCKRIGFLLRL